MNYKKDVVIDPSALDVEWNNQADLALKYGEYWAECKDELDRAEESIKLIRGELVLEVTTDPDKCLNLPEGTKVTGPIIEGYYRSHKKHIKAKKRMTEAMSAERIAAIAHKEIAVTRKAALTNLVTLHGQNYFAGPSVPRNLVDKVADKKAIEESNIKVSKKLKRKKK